MHITNLDGNYAFHNPSAPLEGPHADSLQVRMVLPDGYTVDASSPNQLPYTYLLIDDPKELNFVLLITPN